MIEVLWHGRGGQGAFTAARLLGAASSLADGAYALAFPSFGPERRGAPMRAFTKMDTVPLGDRSAVERADFVIYLDDTLLGAEWDAELKEGGRVLVNSVRPSSAFGDARIMAIDANGLSEKILGRPIPNTVFLGALSVLCDRVTESDVIEAIRQYMPLKLHAKNEQVVAEARARVLDMLASGVGDVSRETSPTVANAHAEAAALAASSAPEGCDPVAGIPSPEGSASDPTPVSVPAATPSPAAPADVWRAGVCIPVLRSHKDAAPSLDPQDFARSTCYEAGHLVAKNAGWRNERPVIDAAACTGCLQCYLYCPDGTIFKTQTQQPQASDAGVAPIAVDYDFCKGCGICAKACKFGANAMIPESEACAR